MRGRHARPSKAARTAVALTPAAAMAAAMISQQLPNHPPVQASTEQPLDRAELDASVTPAHAAPRTYAVRSGDTLWSIAVKFYGSGFQWEKIWHANPQITDPNEISPGERLVIPGGTAPSAGTEAISSSRDVSRSLPGVPATAAYYIRQAATALHLPVAVVAAQNYVESSYGQNMGPSSAGAMGPWQFMPGTWAGSSDKASRNRRRASRKCRPTACRYRR